MYFLGGFPHDTQTFVFNEIEGMEQLGWDVRIVSLHPFRGNDNSLDYERWLSRTCYAGSVNKMAMLWHHVRCAISGPMRYLKFIAGYKPSIGKRVYWTAPHVLSYVKREKVNHIHAHFAWSAAELARAVSALSGVPFSMTAHQSDIHRKPERLKQKLNEAKVILTCTRGNAEHLISTYPGVLEGKIHTVYHGVNINRFAPSENGQRDIDILSVGNLIKVKGFAYLIKALGILNERKKGLQCVIVGDGPERERLLNMIQRDGLSTTCTIIARMTQEKLAGLYAQAKVFVLPCVRIGNAPHGIPNVIAEAMASSTPVVATNVPHIPEIIENGKDGLLVNEKDPEALAETVLDLLNDKKKRLRLGKQGRLKMRNMFDSQEQYRAMSDLLTSIVT